MVSTMTGTSRDPISPLVNTTVEYALILRLGAFFDVKITIDDPGLPDHEPITMDSAGSKGTIIGGAGYLEQGEPGDSGESNFSVGQPGEYRTVTIALAPAD
jgi:hypothetical protein